MNKKELSERDICTKYITPALERAGWDIDLEKKWWKKRKNTQYAWKVSAKAIAERNYNLDSKNPHEVEVNHGDQDELMQEYLEIARQLDAAQSPLKQELIAALGHGAGTP